MALVSGRVESSGTSASGGLLKADFGDLIKEPLLNCSVVVWSFVYL